MQNFMRLAAITLVLLASSSAATSGSIKVTLLGTGYPEPRIDRFGPSILVEAGDEKVLFDCGRGAIQRIEQAGLRAGQLNAVFLTHLHSDHVVGLPDLWLTGWVRGRRTPLRLYGPVGTASMMKHLTEAFDFDIRMRRDIDAKLPPDGVVVLAKDIDDGLVYDSGGVKISAFQVDHGPVRPAFGYRVEYAGHTIVLSGDTRFSENLITHAKGADVLIHEVIDIQAFQNSSPNMPKAQQDKVIGHHTSAEDAGRIFARVHPKLAVYSHIVPAVAPNLVPETRKNYDGPLEIGQDRMTITISDKITTARSPEDCAPQ